MVKVLWSLFKGIPINWFRATDLFLYPLKISVKLCFSDVFRGYGIRLVSWNGLSICKVLNQRKFCGGSKVDSTCHPNLSSLRCRSNEYQKLPGDLVVKSKLYPRSDYVALRQLSPIHKKWPWSLKLKNVIKFL